MPDNLSVTPGTGTQVATDEIGGVHYQRVKIASGPDGSATDVSSAAPLPVSFASGATEATLSALNTKHAALATRPLDDAAPGQPVRVVGQEIWSASFSDSGASVLAPEFATPILTGGVTYNQASNALNINAGVNTNAEFLTRSLVNWRSSFRLSFGIITSQRIANNNFAVLLADLIGEGLSYNIDSATSVTVSLPGHGYTALNVGQAMLLGGITGAAGVPGRYVIASVVPGVSITFTVSGWPASGTGTLTLFGHSYVRNLFNGTSATNVLFDAQRRGWASGDTAAAVQVTTAPGVVCQNEVTGRECILFDQLRATNNGVSSRGTRIENIPDDNLDLHIWLWSFNGTSAPASNTTFTIGPVSVERFTNNSIYIQGNRANGDINPLPIRIVGAAGTARLGFMGGAGIWWDDTSTALAANATFTGGSRDLFPSGANVNFNNSGTFGQELRVSAESDVSGTLWIEASRDNVNWRRVKSVATAAVTGGGQYAEIVHRPSWRYARVGFTNGATAQARLTVGSVAMAI